MPNSKRNKIDCDYGDVLTPLIEGYAKVQGISVSSLLRVIVSESFRNELNNVAPGYKPKITRRSK